MVRKSIGSQVIFRSNWDLALAGFLLSTTIYFGALILILLKSDNLSGFAADDFYYYLKVADNVASGRGSTFGGIGQTNGYHPLWLGLLTLAIMAGKVLRLDAEYASYILIFIAACVEAWLIFKIHVRQSANGNRLISVFICVVSWTSYLNYARQGMEANIFLMVYTLLILKLTTIRQDISVAIWLVASMAILARIDAAIVIIPAILAFEGTSALKLRKVTKAIIGFFPIFCYLLFNFIYFQSLFPVSGLAKSVIVIDRIHTIAFIGIFKTSFGIFNAIALLVATVGFFYIIAVRSNKIFCDPFFRFSIVTLVTVPIFYCLTALRSDWQLWNWYHFPFWCTLFSMLLLVPTIPKNHDNEFQSKWIGSISIVSCTLFIVGWFGLQVKRAPSNSRSEIQQFTSEHEGVFAMGDMAGFVGYVSPAPFVQLEGLVMDRPYLNAIASSRNLMELLNRYDVKYYITIQAPLIEDNGCRIFTEPAQSSGFSRRVVGELCWPKIKQIGNSPTIFFYARPS